MLSPDGRCATFDAARNGYVRGEGCGIVVLKRLAEAEADGDRIWGVVRGSALNQDGASQGLTVPSRPAQEKVIEAALREAGIAAADVDYVEAHGTGTEVGDPVEAEAVGTAYGRGRDPDRPLLIGSGEDEHRPPGIGRGGGRGHQGAAGDEQGASFPGTSTSARRTRRSPGIGLPLKVTAEPTAWPDAEGRPPRAGVSGFGWSGHECPCRARGIRQAGRRRGGGPPARRRGSSGSRFRCRNRSRT